MWLALAADTKLSGHSHQIGQRVRVHFLHDVGTVHLYGFLRGAQFRTSLLVEQPGRYQGEHFPFARGQRLVATVKQLEFLVRSFSSRGCAR